MRRSMPLVGAVVVAAVVLVAGASGASNPASRPARWVITDLGTLGGCCSQAVAINERGQIIGEADTRAKDEEGDPISHAFLWQNGKLRDLGTLGAGPSQASAINDRGQIVGWSDTRPRTRMAIRSVTRRCGRSDTAPDHPWARFWAPTCARGAQKLVLSREVELPGVPARAEFDLRPFSRTVIGSVQLLVNGHIVLDLSAKALGVRDMGEYELGPAELRHFRLGENELRVVATKRALPVSAPACNTGSPESVVGLLFGLRGQSIADLSVSAGKAPIQYVRGSLYQFNGTFTVRNTGPSAAMPDAFEFTIQTTELQAAFNTLTGPIKASPPFRNCTTEGDLTYRLTLRCPFTVLPAGEVGTVSISTVVKVPSGESHLQGGSMIAEWAVSEETTKSSYDGTRDPHYDNNKKSETIVLCGPRATNSNCPPAGG